MMHNGVVRDRRMKYYLDPDDAGYAKTGVGTPCQIESTVLVLTYPKE